MATRDDSDYALVDPTTGNSMPSVPQPGYYPGFSTLSQQAFWDQATRDVVLSRVNHPPAIRFFTPQEFRLATAVFNRIIPQDDRDQDHRIPVVNWVDDRLYTGRIDGYRYDDMPPDREAYRLGLKGIEAVARHMHGKAFVDLSGQEQDEVLWTLHGNNPQGGEEIWNDLPCDRFWLIMLSDAAEGYYSHPYAWDEVGFGGPAYPRGYFRLEKGRPEPWEVEEQRYNWDPPPSSGSDIYRPLGGRHPDRSPAGQEGTH